MGLKTNKTTKTTRLNCQYVGSFAVRDGDKKLPVSEQSKFVDEKLKNCTKKLLDGSPVCLQVSPDGIQVLTSDEKTVKMAHTLRRVSYATAEPTNKLFAYVTHQPGSDMEIVCHTFVTKRKDYAEGLSAALGKLFKQSFAYTLKRRDKLEEAAQKRGGNRRWAKHQVAAGHGAMGRQPPHNENTRSTNTSDARKENEATSRTAVQQRPNQSASPVAKSENERPKRRSPPTIPNRSPSSELDDSVSLPTPALRQIAANQSVSPVDKSENERPKRRSPPGIPNRSPSSELDDPFSPPTPAVRQIAANQSVSPVDKSENERLRRRSPPGIPNRSPSSDLDDPFSPPTPAVRQIAANQSVSPVDKSENERPKRRSPPGIANDPFSPPTPAVRQTATIPHTATVYPPPTVFPNPNDHRTLNIHQTHNIQQTSNVHQTLPYPTQRETSFTPSDPPRSVQQPPPFENASFASFEDQAPPLPSRSRSPLSSPWSSQEADAPPELPSRSLPRRSSAPNSPESVYPPSSLKHYISDSSVGFQASGHSQVPPNDNRHLSRGERKFSAPPNLMPSSPSHPPSNAFRRLSSSGSSGDDFPTHQPWLGNVPPPLPRKSKPQAPPEIPEEVITPEEDERLRQGMPREARISLTLEDEDWYIPGVSRDSITEMLEYSDVGSFFVRDSQSCPGCYALTMKVIKSKNNPTGFGHYLITPDGGGFSLQGFDKSFPDISTLIRHYSSCDDGLPCQLILAGSNPLFHDANGYLVEFMDDEEDMYGNLSDCSSMFRELNMNDPW